MHFIYLIFMLISYISSFIWDEKENYLQVNKNSLSRIDINNIQDLEKIERTL